MANNVFERSRYLRYGEAQEDLQLVSSLGSASGSNVSTDG